MTNYHNFTPGRKTVTILFMVIFSMELAAGIYYGYFLDTKMGDAFARTANAYYVFFVEPPRFASVGLVWNPLPSMLQLPLVAFSQIWKPLVTHGIAAAIISSLFAAASVVVLFKTFLKLNISLKLTFIIISLYATNPFIFFYGFNGMSEGLTFFFMIYAVSCLVLWMKEGAAHYIMRIAFALALAFFCRYEAIPFAAAIGVGVLIIIFFGPAVKAFAPQGQLKETYYYAEGTAIVLYTPLLFAVFLWVMFNWLISGNPLYFLNSAYSNSAYASLLNGGVETPWELFRNVVWEKSAPFIPGFAGLVIVRSIRRNLFKHDFFVLLIMVLAVILFHYLMLLSGSSYGWLRFFSYVLPITVAWLPYEITQTNQEVPTRKLILQGILVMSLLVSWGLTLSTLENPQKSVEEHISMETTESRRIAEYINENLQEEKVLMDSLRTGEILVNIDNMSNIVVTASPDFYESLEKPHKLGITYLLVPNPEEGAGSLDALNARYPNLYAGREEWCEQEVTFEGFKLFRVIY
ncbi:hypothetical protein [Desulforamulus aeronauticus]|uniref:Dolichyl-phosphate-mannose-protein mannosyltransferase n=1 Tax=Desulforamulus aeronauticus DSM 10349 TaxID=1121421 RepID=A0A1M6NEF1_9FIRM|nr:hypothetical protein [Desulforamulus aeronauticus]SHJ94080.1 hypothetical protein SAMN02745123_00088 [Desulforamulus aeronauticus DSM 10349]